MAGILSKFELDFLSDEVQLDENATCSVRYRLKKKLKGLAYLDLTGIDERKTTSFTVDQNFFCRGRMAILPKLCAIHTYTHHEKSGRAMRIEWKIWDGGKPVPLTTLPPSQDICWPGARISIHVRAGIQKRVEALSSCKKGRISIYCLGVG
ncbi:MAG TPA: hypothetical protein VF172_09430 [Nitrososphaera sp.]|jgi:hypothetical protein